MSFILGLDVGTAAGAAATRRDGYVQPCHLGERSRVLPSTVLLHEDGSFLTGEEAARAGGVELVRVARDLRRDPMLEADPKVGGSQVSTPYAMLRALHARVVEDVCTQSSDMPTHVVVTHPALPEGLRCDVVERIASELFPGALLVPEPVAATVKLACDCVLPAEGTVAVYDFGGGTIDLSLVRRDGDRFSTLGEPSGVSDFGGIDVDDMLLSHVDGLLHGAIAQLDLSDRAARDSLARLRAECRTAKERLSYEAEATIDASLAGEPDLLTVRRHELEELLFPRLDESIDALEQLIAAVGLRTSDVDALALVGGSARIPLVAELIRARTHIPVVVDEEPELTIALGAAQMVDEETASASVFPVAGTSPPSPAPGGAYRDAADKDSGAACPADGAGRTGHVASPDGAASDAASTPYEPAATDGHVDGDDYPALFGERGRSKAAGVLAGGLLATVLVAGIAFGLRGPDDAGDDGTHSPEVVDNAVLPGPTSGSDSGSGRSAADGAGPEADGSEGEENHEHGDPTTSSDPIPPAPRFPFPFPSMPPKSSTTKPTPTTRPATTTPTTRPATTTTTTTTSTTTSTTTTTLPDPNE